MPRGVVINLFVNSVGGVSSVLSANAAWGAVSGASEVYYVSSL